MNQDVQRAQLKNDILKISAASFQETALSVFRYQAQFNKVYAEFLSLLGCSPTKVKSLAEIPHLPISLFKSRAIQTGDWPAAQVFSSSGTTGSTTSRHLARDLSFYAQMSIRGFHQFYPPLETMAVLALLPSYLERSNSSLVFMVQEFMKSSHPLSGFFLHDLEALVAQLALCRQGGVPVLLIGVSFALLDLAERYQLDLSEAIVMETGGMKGRRKEITRTALHQRLCDSFATEVIHSEYGMTELFSQGWSLGNGVFRCNATMKVSTREITDPFAGTPNGRTGVLNIIDLANLDTISFIATDDLGKVYRDGSFEVLGRMDGSDIRGCNLLVGDI